MKAHGTAETVEKALNYLAQAEKGGPVSAVPCSVLHPGSISCLAHNVRTWLGTARKGVPIYAALTLVPLVVLRLRALLRRPLWEFTRAFVGVARSTAFLATFCALYQAVVCIHRAFVRGGSDQKVIYWLAGSVAGLAIFLEKKGRRSELALYTLPRALDSLYMLLCDRQWLAGLPHGELLLFCLAMAGLTHFHHHQPSTMSPPLRYAFKWLLKPNAPSS